jgi:zinc and cadmium transporter
MPVLLQILIASIAGGLLSLAIAAAVAFRVKARWIPTLVSYAVGALLAAVFIDILPHVFEQSKNPARIAGCILAGILVFFVLEKLLIWRHHHHGGEEAADHGHKAELGDHGRSGWMIMAGDTFHNFTDGIIIASAFLADARLGVITSIAIIAHEIPQEIGDFLILLHSGFTKKKALIVNGASGLAMVAGALVAYAALSQVEQWIPEILAVASASMIYVAVADLIPGLHKRTELGESLGQVAFIALGIASIWAIHAGLQGGH